ncbi:Helix-turn-helix domain protein [compost metagenome]
MDENILNIEQVVEFLGVSEKTLIKLLREEHVPARKIGRECRFSKKALTDWLASGDSYDYINRNELYQISQDTAGQTPVLFESICESLQHLQENGCNMKLILDSLDRDIIIPEDAKLRISYKQQREVEKLEFKIYWDMREDSKMESNGKQIKEE